jgi:hypothetical protein
MDFIKIDYGDMNWIKLACESPVKNKIIMVP